jgi:hypothetical protein
MCQLCVSRPSFRIAAMCCSWERNDTPLMSCEWNRMRAAPWWPQPGRHWRQPVKRRSAEMAVTLVSFKLRFTIPSISPGLLASHFPVTFLSSRSLPIKNTFLPLIAAFKKWLPLAIFCLNSLAEYTVGFIGRPGLPSCFDRRKRILHSREIPARDK